MIPCYELRIGNLVIINGMLQRVSAITRTTISTVDADENNDQTISEHSLEKVEPVILTDEVLKECGFVYHDYFKFWQLITTGIRTEMDIDPDYDLIDFMRKPIIKKLRSLHQLQNVYFLMKGRELKYTKQAIAA